MIGDVAYRAREYSFSMLSLDATQERLPVYRFWVDDGAPGSLFEKF